MPTKRKTRKMKGGSTRSPLNEPLDNLSNVQPNGNEPKKDEIKEGSYVIYKDVIYKVTKIDNDNYTIIDSAGSENNKVKKHELRLYTKNDMLMVPNNLIRIALSEKKPSEALMNSINELRAKLQ